MFDLSAARWWEEVPPRPRNLPILAAQRQILLTFRAPDVPPDALEEVYSTFLVPHP